MVHTLPDYTTKYKLAKIFGNIDDAELAARLGACSTMDRRGNLIWYDDFEAAAAIKWLISVIGGTGALSTERAWMGNQSMKTVTGAILNDQVSISKHLCLPVERRIAAEFMFCMKTGNPTVTLYIAGYDGTNYYESRVRYIHSSLSLQYYNSGSAWVNLPLVDNTDMTSLELWLLMKLTVDWDKKEYVRLIFCGTEYDLSGIAIKSGASAMLKGTEVVLVNQTPAAAVATVYFDNFIITQNEP